MFEVEVKARVKDMAALRLALASDGCIFSEPIKQRDTVYTPNGVTIHPVPTGTNVLRLREQNGKYKVTLKQPRANELDCLEVEFSVENPEQVLEMFRLLGFHEFSVSQKVRVKGRWNGLEVCLDTVDELGDFIELEKLSAEGDPVEMQKELFAMLQRFGITEADQVHHGYDILLAKKRAGLL